jgi:hypothetical protein
MRDIADMDELVYDTDYLSSCCGHYILMETDVCGNCGEHCDPEREDEGVTDDTNLKFKYQ